MSQVLPNICQVVLLMLNGVVDETSCKMAVLRGVHIGLVGFWILKRYDIYMETTKPVLEFYNKNPRFYEIDGSLKIDEITAKIDDFLAV